jgi:hypothetical protein
MAMHYVTVAEPSDGIGCYGVDLGSLTTISDVARLWARLWATAMLGTPVRSLSMMKMCY